MDKSITDILAIRFKKLHTCAEVNSYFLQVLDEYENCVQAESVNGAFAEERIQLKEKLRQLFLYYLKKHNGNQFKNNYGGRNEN